MQATGACQEAEELSSEACSSELSSSAHAAAPEEISEVQNHSQIQHHDVVQQLLDPGSPLTAATAYGQQAQGE